MVGVAMLLQNAVARPKCSDRPVEKALQSKFSLTETAIRSSCVGDAFRNGRNARAQRLP
jgi:hypothetical protein